jgi:hypothetical protein
VKEQKLIPIKMILRDCDESEGKGRLRRSKGLKRNKATPFLLRDGFELL